MSNSNEIIADHWVSFYKICGITTIVMMVLFLFDVIIWILLGPYPNTSIEWYSLLNENRPGGLLLLSFPTLIGTILYFLTFLGLYNILRQTNPAYSILASIFSFVGLIVLIDTSMAYSMVYLSDQYFNTVNETHRTVLLAAGEAKISTTVSGFQIGGLFVETAAVIFSILMLKSKIFNNTVALLGILGHGLDLIRIILILAFIPEDKVAILLMIGGLPQLIWLIIVGERFFQIGKRKTVKIKKHI